MHDMRCILIGNYGAGNMGDEALKQYFLDAFGDIEWQVISAAPKNGELYRLPLGVRSIFRPWWKTLAAIRMSDAVVFGGGTMFTDIESIRACLLWWLHALAASLLGKRIFFAFQGIGPFRTRAGEWLAKNAVKRGVFLSVRDAHAFVRASSWGISGIVQTFDPVFLLMYKQKIHDRTQKMFIVIPRHTSGEEFLQKAVAFRGSSSFTETHILSMQPDHKSEQAACTRLRSALGDKARIIPIRSLDELLAALRGASLLLSQRYHGALAALALDIPLEIVAQEEDDKISSLRAVRTEDLPALCTAGEQALRNALIFAK